MEILIILLIFCILSIIFSALGGAAWIFTRPIPGDKCTGEDPNAEYEIDENGKCVFSSCKLGYEFDGISCVVIEKDDVVVEADAEADAEDEAEAERVAARGR